MNHFHHKRTSEVIDECGFGFHVTLERFELKLNPPAYISCTPQHFSLIDTASELLRKTS
jgi:hypothetical protein